MSLDPIEQTPHTDLTGKVIKTEEHYFAYGGFSEIYRGRLKDTNEIVAIKLLRGVHTDPETLEKTTRRIYRESRVWHDLKHDNILPFLGISTSGDLGPSPALISPLCEEGHVIQYLQRHPETDRSKLLLQIARGLDYLHSKDIVHGDLKCNNILMHKNGYPLLCDFGRSKILGQAGFTTVFSGTTRYLAPELLGPEVEDEESGISQFVPTLSKQTDVYGFGMIALEILTGNMPFHPITNDFALILRVKKGIPSRLAYPAKYERTWKVVEKCWAKEVSSRPKMSIVVQDLSAL
ncbi:Serine/threonine-protein kinase STY17 [Hypsizygus marmoreus]|uniref:Serine/threonine-protein kinase STY17 n=1 Tax=Hypsizygus marmoreus TaxID=39966 RepID=A0A369JKE8_HYPMA|nr:Serine/threonine-protein kinase STY17 [Hypsizygus marmoreus]